MVAKWLNISDWCCRNYSYIQYCAKRNGNNNIAEETTFIFYNGYTTITVNTKNVCFLQETMLCGRLVKRKHKEGDSGKMSGTDCSSWQHHTVSSGVKRPRVMLESATRDRHTGSMLTKDMCRKLRGDIRLKTSGRTDLHIKSSFTVLNTLSPRKTKYFIRLKVE